MSPPSPPLQGGLSRGRPPRVPLTTDSRQQASGGVQTRSSCCLCAHKPSAGRDPAAAGPFALGQTGWRWRRVRQRPRLRMAPTVPTVTNLPPGPRLPSRIPRPLFPEVTSFHCTGLQGHPPPPSSGPRWVSRLPSPPSRPQARWACCKVAYLLSFDSFIKTCTYATGRRPLLSEPTPFRTRGLSSCPPICGGAPGKRLRGAAVN